MDLISQLEAMELENKGYKFLKIDTYKNRLISDRYGVEEIPTLLKIEAGEVVSKLVKPEKEEIKELI
jgi:thioredoxin reductase (NADPH)